jgi:HipA-like protein
VFKPYKLQYKTPPPTIELLFDGEPVAELTRGREATYSFHYLAAFEGKKLAPLPGFPQLDKVYTATELFPFFRERIPDMRRPEVREQMKNQNISEEDLFALLVQLGRRTVTDSFELRLSGKAA